MTLLIVRSNYNKEFVYFIPSKFQKARGLITGKQYAFYWINNNQLITCMNEKHCVFFSTDKYFIFLDLGIVIANNREFKDMAALDRG